MDGGRGNDTVLGELGNDTLYGGRGDDTISGGDGRDVIIGGIGDDVGTGGADADTFVVGTLRDEGEDIEAEAYTLRITDFDTTGGDADILHVRLDNQDEADDLAVVPVEGSTTDLRLVLNGADDMVTELAVIEGGVAIGFDLDDVVVIEEEAAPAA
jgi:Ca2+-binding RTX toxin-like protein